MARIKIITDSASDISKEYAQKYDIEVIGFNITVGDKSFRDGDIQGHLGSSQYDEPRCLCSI